MFFCNISYRIWAILIKFGAPFLHCVLQIRHLESSMWEILHETVYKTRITDLANGCHNGDKILSS